MLEEIAQDNIVRTSASNQPMFSTDVDYDEVVLEKEKACTEWKSLDDSTRRQFANLTAFEAASGVRDVKDPKLIPAKNLSLVLKEIKKRVDREDPLRLLGIEPLDLYLLTPRLIGSGSGSENFS